MDYTGRPTKRARTEVPPFGFPNQSLNTTDAVQFDQVSVQDFDLKAFPNALSITKEGEQGSYSIGANGFIYRQRSLNGGDAVGTVITRSRGTLDVPLGLLANDGIFVNFYRGHDGTSGGRGAQQGIQASENWTVGNHGTVMRLYTVNNGTTALDEKLRLDSSGVTVNNAFTLPLTDGTSQQLLTTDGLGATAWESLNLEGLENVSLTNLQPDDMLTYNLPLNVWFNTPKPPVPEKSAKYSQALTTSVLGNQGEQSIVDTNGAQGSVTIPAGSLQDADIYRIKAICAFENDSKNDGYVVRIKVGGTTIATSPVTRMSATTQPRSCEISTQLKFITAGNIFNAQIDCVSVDDNDQKEADTVINVITPGINPGIANTIDVTVEWSTLSILKRLFIRQLTIEKLIV